MFEMLATVLAKKCNKAWHIFLKKSQELVVGLYVNILHAESKYGDDNDNFSLFLKKVTNIWHIVCTQYQITIF